VVVAVVDVVDQIRYLTEIQEQSTALEARNLLPAGLNMHRKCLRRGIRGSNLNATPMSVSGKACTAEIMPVRAVDFTMDPRGNSAFRPSSWIANGAALKAE
jgi:hypothetical protein